jgi:hypothetical protein
MRSDIAPGGTFPDYELPVGFLRATSAFVEHLIWWLDYRTDKHATRASRVPDQ